MPQNDSYFDQLEKLLPQERDELSDKASLTSSDKGKEAKIIAISLIGLVSLILLIVIIKSILMLLIGLVSLGALMVFFAGATEK